MFVASKGRSLLRRGFLCATASLAVIAAAAPAAAQEEESPEETTVIVTGSRIVRPNITAPTPVQVLGAEKIEGQGFENLSDVLVTLPQFSAAFGNARTQSTFSGQANSGLNQTNLRNLSPRRSLTLINGRRAPAGEIDSSSVDFNMLPSANIKRVEVITGGASAIYGADAVAGVINIITDDEFEGVEFGLSYGEQLDNHDNQNPSGFLRLGGGFADDRGHASLTLQYDYQGLVRCADRYLCAEDFFWSPTAANPNNQLRGAGTSPANSALSGIPPQGRFLVGAGNGRAAQDLTLAGGQVVPFQLHLHGYNRNGRRTLAIPTERTMLAAQADYEINEFVSAFAEINYGSSTTDAPFEGHPFQSTSDLIGSISAGQGGVESTIPRNNPFIPTAIAQAMDANGDAELSWLQRFDSLGLRGAQNKREMVRAVAGLEGDFEDLMGFGANWSWEASYTYGRTTLDSVTNGLVARDRLFYGLRVEQVQGAPAGTYRCVDPVARASGCVPINPFQPYTQAMADYITVNASMRGMHELESGLAFMTGEVLELPAGPLKVALGLESRRTTAFQDFPDPINRGLTTGNRIFDNPETNFRTNEAYVEALVPVLADLPLIEELNLEGAYRWSDSSNFGSYDTWKFGGDWSPVSGLRLRAMQARSVRAPVLDEVTGGFQTAGNINDPCANDRITANAVRTANCAAEGIPTTYNPPVLVRQGVQGYQVGNPDLTPEIADTLTYGLVFDASAANFMPQWLDGLTITLDRFDITIEDVITTTGRQTIADLCYDLQGAARDQYCGLVTRGFSQIAGVPYALLTVNDTVDNLAELSVAGIDLEVSYGFALGDLFGGAELGDLNFNAIMTFYDKAEQIVGGTKLELLGFAGGSTSDQGFLEKQGNFTVGWTGEALRGAITARWIPETKQSPFQNAFTPNIPETWYFDGQARWAFSDNLEIYGGVNNITDEDPPFFISGASGTQALDTIPAFYDVIGRQGYVGFKARF